MAQSRFWLTTYPLTGTDADTLFIEKLTTNARGGVYVKQCSLEPHFFAHIQVYCEFNRTRRCAWLCTNVEPLHWETRQGTRAQAIAYHTENEKGTNVDDPVFFGNLTVTQGERTDLELACEFIRNGDNKGLLQECPTTFVKFHKGLAAYQGALLTHRNGTLEDRPKVSYLWGPTRSGKTRRAFAAAAGPTQIFFKDPGNRWWDGYHGQTTVVIDDISPEHTKTSMSVPYLLRLLDMYPMTVEVKGSSTIFNSPMVFLTSNLPLDEVFATADPRQLDALRARLFENVEMILE